MKTKKQAAAQDLDGWIARDLSRAAEAGELLPAFEVEPLVEQVCAVLSAGKHPLLLGDSGVGKTAVIHELLRRHRAGRKISRLDGSRVVQVSIRKLETEATDNQQTSSLLRPLLEAALACDPPLTLHVTDGHRAMQSDLADLFQRFATRTKAPMLVEGERVHCLAQFEVNPELLEVFVPVYVDEPGLPAMERLLSGWADEQERRGTARFTPSACESALYLAHRFLARTRLPRAALDLLSQTAALAGPDARVDRAGLIERFCATQRVQRDLVDPERRLDLDAVAREFGGAVLGQPEAVKAMVTMIGALKAGLSDTRRSLGVFLFVGPTGVGKTHLAQVVASYMFGGRERMLRFNMADFQGPSAEELFGARGGYGDRRGELTRRMLGCPFGVVLLDEFEKAEEQVRDRFLQLFDEGAFVNGANELVSCRSMVFIATSNAGAEIFRGSPFGFLRKNEPGIDAIELQQALERSFRFELLNRFDAVVHFYPLSREDIRAIGLREIELLKSRAGLRHRNVQLEVDESVLDWLAANGYDAQFGARFLRRTVERHVTAALADALVRRDPAPGSTVALLVRANRIRAEVLERERRPAARVSVLLPAGTQRGKRVLDEPGLRVEAEHILRSAQGLLRRLEAQRDEYSTLLERMNDASLWTDASQRPAVMQRFRELDVALRMQERLAAPLLQLAEVCRQAPAPELAQLADCVAQAAASQREWELRLDEEGPSTAWLVLSNVDPLHAASEWLAQLSEMELAWCRERLHLAAGVVAYEASGADLRRVVVEVEGPGAFAQLRPERGLHRLHQSHGREPRVRMEVLARGSAQASAWPRLEPAPRRAPRHFGLTPRCRGRLELEKRGSVVEFLAENEEALQQLLNDLREPWSAPPREPDVVARHYNEDGSGARDPRTGAVAANLKDVLRGGLEPFLEAWRRTRRADAAEVVASPSQTGGTEERGPRA